MALAKRGNWAVDIPTALPTRPHRTVLMLSSNLDSKIAFADDETF